MSLSLTFLNELLSATRQGKLRWSKTDFDRFEAEIAGKHFRIEFIYLMRTDEIGSDRTLARLSAFGWVADYCIGTEGYTLLNDVLAFGNQEWIEHQERYTRALMEGITFLRELQ